MDNNKPQHVAMDQFPIIDNSLHIGGISIAQMAQRVGQTPFYAYDRSLISDRVASLRKMLPNKLHLHYAIKANPMPAVVQHLSRITDGLDVASLGEMQIALDTGVPADHISFAGPGKSDIELRAATAAGVIINIESSSEMIRLSEIAHRTGIKPIVSIRVNADFELKSSGMKMGGGAKPFGVDAEKVPALLNEIEKMDLDWRGFHIFTGSQNLRPEALIEAQSKTFELAYRLSDTTSMPLRWLNIGGGFGIPYFPGEQHLDLEPVTSNLEILLDKASARIPDSEIVIELGRYLVGEAGIYVSQVVDKKVSRDETYLVSNGGMHHHLSASGNFGQIIRKNYPVMLGNKVNDKKREIATIVGPLCTPLDIIASKLELPIAEVGDYIVVFQSGAYGFTASPNRFLSHPSVVEVLV
ncbi:MAG: pyridoxal-dependent decarboxylase, exosortase A system-associated [Candidatus Brocadiaceae bacterium]|nr:pyridoxal-dependent decarboxylase, exosortase A system-associated [Candidatus Brocadiaceae bacterium]